MRNAARKHVLLFLTNGFEDLEAVTALSLCHWTEYRPHLQGIEVTVAGLHNVAHGRFGTMVPVDVQLDKADPLAFDALVVPGGFHDAGFNEAYCQPLSDFALAIHANGGFIATMCVGILPIAESGLLRGGKATTYSFSSKHDNFGRLKELGCAVRKEPVVCWNRIASCAGPAYSEQVVEAMLRHLVGDADTEEIMRFRRGIDA